MMNRIIKNKNIKIVCKTIEGYLYILNNKIYKCDINDFMYFIDSDYNTIIYMNDIDVDIFNWLNDNNFNYNEDVIIKSMQYSSYIDCLNRIYFVNVRFKNKWLKIINLKMIFNYKIKIEDMIKNKIEYAIKKIINKYGINNTFGKYAENIFYNLDSKNKYKFINKEKSNDYARESFYGGLNYINNLYKNKKIKNVNIIDINSLYPFIMKNFKLPQYDGIYYKGEYVKNKVFDLYIQHIKVDFKLLKNGIPILKFNKIDFLDEVINSSEGQLIDLYLNNIDLELFLKNYKIYEIYYIDGFMFSSSTNNFKQYVDKFYKLRKTTKNKFLEKFYKLLLNSLFGKFAKKKKLQKKIPVFDKNKLQLKLSNKLLKTKRGYAPVSSFVASYGRQIIINYIDKLKDDFIYTDTDSLHFVNDKNLALFKINNKLGNFKIIEKNCNAKYIKLKYYILENKKKYKRVLAGIPEEFKKKINFKNFKKGKKINIKRNILKNGKKVSKKVSIII